jgi:hypothetical protein
VGVGVGGALVRSPLRAALSVAQVYMRERVHAEIKRPLDGDEAPYEIHPWNYTLAALVAVFGGAALALAFLGLILLKLVPLLLRAVINHARSAGAWFKGGHLGMIVAYLGYFIGIPVVAALSLPASIAYGFYVGAQCGGTVVQTRGKLYAARVTAGKALDDANRQTNRYMFNQNVPFLVLPSANPIHIQWLLAAVIPVVVGLVVDTPVCLLIAAISYVPVTVRARRWRWAG